MEKVNLWPQSQECIGCIHGSLINDVEKYGCCAYICEYNRKPNLEEVNGCKDFIGENI